MLYRFGFGWINAFLYHFDHISGLQGHVAARSVSPGSSGMRKTCVSWLQILSDLDLDPGLRIISVSKHPNLLASQVLLSVVVVVVVRGGGGC